MRVASPLIRFQDVSFTYAGRNRESLRGIRAEIPRGACIVLTGASGCGKTTLTRCVNSLVPHFYEGTLTGRAEVMGRDILETSAGETGRHVASVFQDPRTQFFTTDSTAEVAFACENYGMPAPLMRERVRTAFEHLGIGHLEGRSVFSLSSGERQKVAAAAAWALGPEVFVLDEPSANLDAHAIAQLRGILAALKAEGHTMLISEHRLYYLKDVADEFWLVAEGELVQTLSAKEVLRIAPDAWRKKGLRQLNLSRMLLRNEAALISPASGMRLEVEHLRFRHRGQPELLRDVCFSARGGETVAIVGGNGCGKTTLGKLLSGLVPGCGATVKIDGTVCKRDALSRHCYFVMQEADHQLYTDSVERELLLGFDKHDGALRERAREGLRALGLDAFAQAHPCSLSGGQKQRLTILCAALSGKPVVFLDEPTSGLDYASMLSVAGLVHRMRAEGRLVFVISHDLEFLSLVLSRSLVLRDGRIAADFPVRSQADFARLTDMVLPREEVMARGGDACVCG